MKTFIITASAVLILALLGGGAFIGKNMIDSQKAEAAAAQRKATVAERTAQLAEDRQKDRIAKEQAERAKKIEAANRRRVRQRYFLGFRKQIESSIEAKYQKEDY